MIFVGEKELIAATLAAFIDECGVVGDDGRKTVACPGCSRPVDSESLTFELADGRLRFMCPDCGDEQ